MKLHYNLITLFLISLMVPVTHAGIPGEPDLSTTATLTLSSHALALAAQGIFTEASGAGNQTDCENRGSVWNTSDQTSYCESKARKLIITNTDSVTAINVTYQVTPSLPKGTTITPESCGDIPASGTCELTIIPGKTPAAPQNPSVIKIQSANAPTPIMAHISLITYGSRYQGGLVFAIDDTSKDTAGIKGKVAAFTDEINLLDDEQPYSFLWAFDNNATTMNSISDGVTNTKGLAIPQGQYEAAQACLNKTDENVQDWYLPAICEMGYDAAARGNGCGVKAAPLLQNLFSNLKENNRSGLEDVYWSSTESTSLPNYNAWLQFFDDGSQNDLGKIFGFRVRCVRRF